ncbi:MAG: hypothetical protein IJ035_07265 [Oscillospiraceae bacterium]|nr:hypothetical protein [Oscillospiraceae bacterium]
MTGKKKLLTIFSLCIAIAASGCGIQKSKPSAEIINESAYTEPSESLVINNQYALTSAYGGEAYNEPFSSYTYDFSVYGNNYMITVTPDETTTGLTLTVEDNQFGFSTFSVTPPNGYMVMLPYTQQQASQVCTVIKNDDNGWTAPNLLKIDFYLSSFEDETLPYTVSRLYSILDNRLVEVEVYNTISDEEFPELSEDILEPMDYIPDSYLYQTEEDTFMPEPTVYTDEDGNLRAKVITYTINYNDMTMRRGYEDVTSVDNALYYGYAAHAIAGDIYKYFIATSLNVSDYENFVEIPDTNSETSQYFFKVDDPRFSTVDEFKEYVRKYFDDKLVSNMFLTAPQQYRDIDGELHTLLGDGGMNPNLGKLTITGWVQDGSVITYHTKQETFDDNYNFTGYVDGGDFVIEVIDGGFVVKEYRYPSL